MNGYIQKVNIYNISLPVFNTGSVWRFYKLFETFLGKGWLILSCCLLLIEICPHPVLLVSLGKDILRYSNKQEAIHCAPPEKVTFLSFFSVAFHFVSFKWFTCHSSGVSEQRQSSRWNCHLSLSSERVCFVVIKLLCPITQYIIKIYNYIINIIICLLTI